MSGYSLVQILARFSARRAYVIAPYFIYFGKYQAEKMGFCLVWLLFWVNHRGVKIVMFFRTRLSKVVFGSGLGLSFILFLEIYLKLYFKRMKYMSSQNNSESGVENRKKVDWNDYNYPCCLNLFHFDSDQVPEAITWRIRLLRICHILIIFTMLWNFVNNIVNAAQGVQDGVIRIIISIFTTLIFFPISLYYFYLPYRIYMKEDESTCLTYILQAIVFLFFVIWSIADFADANGWVMLAKNAGESRGGASFFSFFSAFFCTVIAILSFINTYKFCKRDEVSD